ncbi:ATP-binding protein [Cohnella rhizosphaerae]|uniref:ATP-binding protein n=1 Tax=Cohnella rhizosphaerae TaxID=1457232 RepID=UPI0030B8AF77
MESRIGPGSVTIQVSSGKPGIATVAVIDDGLGMDEQTLAKLLQKIEGGSQQTASKKGGGGWPCPTCSDASSCIIRTPREPAAACVSRARPASVRLSVSISPYLREESNRCEDVIDRRRRAAHASRHPEDARRLGGGQIPDRMRRKRRRSA